MVTEIHDCGVTVRHTAEHTGRTQPTVMSSRITARLISCFSGFSKKVGSWAWFETSVKRYDSPSYGTHVLKRNAPLRSWKWRMGTRSPRVVGTSSDSICLRANNSLLSWGLKLSVGTNQLAEPVRDLCDLLRRHYAPQLNGQGLFQNCEAASGCLRSMTALQGLSPNLFEGGDLREFRPVGLYTVASRPASEPDTMQQLATGR